MSGGADAASRLGGWRVSDTGNEQLSPPGDDVMPPGALPTATAVPPRYGLRAGAYRLLADSNVSVQVVDMPRMCPFPNAPPGFRGVVNLRGELVPVFDLGGLTGEPPVEAGKLAVCGDGRQRAGLLVERMPDRIGIDELSPDPGADLGALPPALSQAVHGASRREGELWLEVDYDMLFRNLAEPTEASVARTRVADADSAEVLG